MRTLLFLATMGIMTLAAASGAQESTKQPAKGELTKAVYWVPNQH